MEANKFLKNSFRAWNILPSAFLELCNRETVQLSTNSEDSPKDITKISTWRELFAPFVKQRTPLKIDENGIAHIEIKGALFQSEAPFIVASYGGTNYEELLDDLKQAEINAKGIFLKIDSPGGHASGNADTAKAFANIKLPVVVHAKNYCCSAAYAIASGANYIFANPDTLIGSIGTILPLLDISELWQEIFVWGNLNFKR